MIWTNRVVVINTDVEETLSPEMAFERGRKICFEAQSVSHIKAVRHVFFIFVDEGCRLYIK